MERRPRVPVRHRRVSNELRALRKKSGFTCKEVAEALDWSIIKVSRMETGARGLYVDDVAVLLGRYQVSAKKRCQLIDMVRNGAERNWQRLQAGKTPSWADVITLERDAVALRNFEPLIVPGLLQIPEYARAVIRELSTELSEAEVDVLVARRMARSANLAEADDGPTLHVILDEAVLRRPIGGLEVMCRQLEHLISCATKPNVRVQVVPFAAGVTSGISGSFLILDFADHPSLVYMEHREATAFLEDDEYLQRSREAFRRLRMVSLSPDDSLRFITGITGWMEQRAEARPGSLVR